MQSKPVTSIETLPDFLESANAFWTINTLVNNILTTEKFNSLNVIW